MYMCLHVTQHKAPCTCLSLSSTHIDTKNLLSLPQSLDISHTHIVSLSLANTLNKGFPVNNLPSIHQQSWQYGEHETWKRINLHVLRPPSMTTRTRASQKARRRHPLLVGDGKIFVLHSREVIVLRPHMPRCWIECRCLFTETSIDNTFVSPYLYFFSYKKPSWWWWYVCHLAI